MNKDWFEQALRDKYPAEASDFDTDAAWTALQARRGRKRRRAAFWWFSGAGIVALGAAVLFWPKATPQPDDLKAVTPIATVSPIAGKQTASIPSPVATAPLVSETHHKGTGESKPAWTEPKSFATRPAIVKTKLPTKTTGRGQLDAPPLAANSQPELVPELEPTVGNIAKEAPLATLPGIHHSPFIIHHSFLPEPLAAYWLGEKKKSKSKTARWWLGVSAHYGLAGVYRAGENESYIEKRSSEETALDMFQTGLDVRYHLKSNFFLQTGLSFAQWTDVRERIFQENYTVRDSNYLIGQLIKADGSVQNIYGPVDIVHIHTTTAETYNRYRHIELPLLAGVSLPVGGTWRFDCAAGPVFGLLSARSGSIWRQDGNADLPLQDAPYRNSGTISGMLRLEWVYAGNGWSAGIGVMGRLGLTDWAVPGKTFTEKRHAVGTGLVFRKALR